MTGFRLGLFLVLMMVLVSGFLGTRIFERSLKGRMEKALSQAFGCQATAGGFFVHWTSRTIVVRDLSLTCPMTRKRDGGEGFTTGPPPGAGVVPLVFVKRIAARFDLLSLLNRVMDLESLTFEGGKVSAMTSGNRDNYRDFLARWVSGARPDISGAATIQKISIRDTDLSVRFSDSDITLTLHAAKGTLRPNLFMNRFRLDILSGAVSGEYHGHKMTSPLLRVTASFARGGVPDLAIMTRSGAGFLKLEGQVLSFDTEPVVSLFLHGAVPLEVAETLLSFEPSTHPPGLSGIVAFKSYVHGRLNNIKARAVFSSADLHAGGLHMTDARMILSWRPGQLEARPVRLTIDGTRISGSVLADLSAAPPVALVRIDEKGRGGVVGAFGLSASGRIPLPSAPGEWGDFIENLLRLAKVS